VFVASPLEGGAADEKGMVKLAKRLKKNNVAVDVVAYGDGIEEGGERGVLKAFVDSASSGDNSCVPPPIPLLFRVLTECLLWQTSSIDTPGLTSSL
jgi:26S proteasome regulatory subunit N10